MSGQPTWEAMRAALKAAESKGYKHHKGLYAAMPGSGPEGRTCRTCDHLRHTGGRRTFPKCGLVAYTAGDATTIRTATPACSKYANAAAPAARPLAGDR